VGRLLRWRAGVEPFDYDVPMSDSPVPLSAPAKRTLGFGLLTAATTVALPAIFAFAQRFNGDDVRDGWLTGLLSVGGMCGNVFLGVVFGLATVISAMSAITSPNSRDRNAARLGLGFIGATMVALLWGQLGWRGDAPARSAQPDPPRDRACEAAALAGEPCKPR
jgi:hypothetical protein